AAARVRRAAIAYPIPRPPSFAGLRGLARGLRVHAEVVERTRDDRQRDRGRLAAPPDRPGVVVTLGAGDGADGQPRDQQCCPDPHCYLRRSACAGWPDSRMPCDPAWPDPPSGGVAEYRGITQLTVADL